MIINFFRNIFQKVLSWFRQFFVKSAVTNNPDSETLSLLKDPKFLSTLEQAREQKGKGGLSEEEMRRLLGIESAQDV